MEDFDKLELQNRLIDILDYLGCGKNKSLFAKKVKANPHTIIKVYNRKNIPTLKLMSMIAVAFPDINYNWLLTGNGKMILGKSTHNTNPISIKKENNINHLNQLKEKDTIIHDKDNKIIDLQDKVTILNQKIIDLLEGKIKDMQ